MERLFEFKPWYNKRVNKWRVAFPVGLLTDNKKYKFFKTEEEARLFVLELIPDAYDEKIETERCCIDCKHILPMENFKCCNTTTRCCVMCRNARHLKTNHKRRENGLCKHVHCNKLNLINSELCYEHWFQKKATHHLKDYRRGIELINIYEKQNRRCVYTGVELIPNNNMSLDHIASRYDAPELINNINNLQWVHKDINTMKTRFSHNSFISLCKYIANKF